MAGQDDELRQIAPPANAREFGTQGVADVDVYVDDAAMRDAVAYAFSAKDKLLLGVLAGELCAWEGRTYVTVRAFIPARKAVSSTGAAKFTREAWEDVKRIRLERYPRLRMVGWMQSLPGFGVVVTQMSASLHQSYFDLPHQVLLTVDPVSDDVGFFGWKAGKLERTGFRAFAETSPSAAGAAPTPAAASAPAAASTPNVMPATGAGRSGTGRSVAVPVPGAPAHARPGDTTRTGVAPAPTPLPPRTFIDLLAEHGMVSLHRQLHVADQLGNHSWSMDLDEGKLALGDHSFPVQVLGTFADVDRTWLWGWANAESGIPESTLAAARVLQRLGTQHGIAELTEPMVPLARLDPAALMLVATGVCAAAFSYRAPYDGGAAYLLIPLPGLGPPPQDLEVAVNVITMFIAEHEVPHREALRPYLRFLGLGLEETAGRLVCRSPRGGSLVIEMDASSRFTRVSARP